MKHSVRPPSVLADSVSASLDRSSNTRPELELDPFIHAFERARIVDPDVPLDDFLPPNDHPLRLIILCELVRVDIEFGWIRRQALSLGSYAVKFPELFDDPFCREQVVFEEYRQRREHGESPAPEEYRFTWDVDTEGWPGTEPEETAADETPDLGSCVLGDAFQSKFVSPAGDRPASPPLAWPKPGSRFLGFDLGQELGRGAFARVYLARQEAFASREVVLKLSTDHGGEPRSITPLQHTHIVPIYSVQQAEAFEAVCMPYLGAATLFDLLADLRTRDSVPTFGGDLFSSVRSRTRPASERVSSQSPSVAPASAPHSDEPHRKFLDRFGQGNYVETVLWIGARLGEGLAHAHARGILHRGLKPANVLLTDDGQPMLLDFQLPSENQSNAESRAKLSGKLPYMAPECLQQFLGTPGSIDKRSDVYSLGLILYELLAGRYPFARVSGSMPERLAGMLAQRQKGPGSLRAHNREVSLAAESIILKCLEPKPERRYQSAQELAEDIDRHLSHRPLKHAANTSVFERARKWARRHPRLSSRSTIAGFTLLVGLCLAGMLWMWNARLATVKATEQYLQFLPLKHEAELLVTLRQPDQDELPQDDELLRGIALSRELLDGYGVLDDPQWREDSKVRYLSIDQQRQLREHIGELLFFLARAESVLAEAGKPAERAERLRKALNYNHDAQEVYPSDQIPEPIEQQRDELTARLEDRPVPTPAREGSWTAREWYLAGSDRAAGGDFEGALPFVLRAVEQDPTLFSAWMVIGVARTALGRLDQAESAFTVALALNPASRRAAHFRGLGRYRQGLWDLAIADFSRVLAQEPTDGPALFHRAIARAKAGNLRGGVADLSAALESGFSPIRVYPERARLLAQLGEEEAAERDRQLILRQEPTEASGWIARANHRTESEPEAALADLEQALRLDPLSRRALRHQADLLADRLSRTDDAIAVLDRLLQLDPSLTGARARRGVWLARLGKREPALADAEASLQQSASPEIWFTVAKIYAQLSRDELADADRAMELLAAALEAGYGRDQLATDRDLAPLLDLPAFQKWVP